MKRNGKKRKEEEKREEDGRRRRTGCIQNEYPHSRRVVGIKVNFDKNQSCRSHREDHFPTEGVPRSAL